MLYSVSVVWLSALFLFAKLKLVGKTCLELFYFYKAFFLGEISLSFSLFGEKGAPSLSGLHWAEGDISSLWFSQPTKSKGLFIPGPKVPTLSLAYAGQREMSQVYGLAKLHSKRSCLVLGQRCPLSLLPMLGRGIRLKSQPMRSKGLLSPGPKVPTLSLAHAGQMDTSQGPHFTTPPPPPAGFFLSAWLGMLLLLWFSLLHLQHPPFLPSSNAGAICTALGLLPAILLNSCTPKPGLCSCWVLSLSQLGHCHGCFALFSPFFMV